MASTTEVRSSPFQLDPHQQGHHHNQHQHQHPHHQPMPKSIPILPSSASPATLSPPRDPMDVTPSQAPTMGPPGQWGERNGHTPQANNANSGETESGSASNGASAAAISAPSLALGAQAAAQQPQKVIQTAFIHKLYNMLEDQTISHLISWASNNENFVMSPSSEFSKVLSSYFKHTNISSFVRQLNMYGFHKVSDVFHGNPPDSPMWEFKHGNGHFKRGDLAGLRDIKRRASRHALIHRDSFSTATPKVPAGPPPGAPVDPVPDPAEARLQSLEMTLYDMQARIQRSEDSYAYLNQRNMALVDGMLKCHQWNQELSSYIMAIVPDQESRIHKDVYRMQQDIARQTDLLRTHGSIDDPPHEPLSARQSYFMQLDNTNAPPLSPRQMPQDNFSEQRRPSLAGSSNSRQGPFRPPMPPHIAISPRRTYGSIGTGNYSPSSARTPATHQPPPPQPPSIQHPGASLGAGLGHNASPPYNHLYRRHTSADIRTHPGWPPQQPPSESPYASGHNSSQWPSSPHRTPIGGGDQQLRDALEQYQLPRGPHHQSSRQGTPPLASDTTPPNLNGDGNWSLGTARYSSFKGHETPGPPTRRSSMASNVHSLLNPTAERPDEDEPEDARKRKRMQ